MHFKYPEILYFLFLLIVPILVHLFQFRRFKKEYFTNVQFLKELSVQTRKSSTLKKWLLLVTRLLLLTFIIIAFAQPYFPAKDSTSASNEMYIILDNSFSMQAKGQKGELLRRAVQELLEEIPENTRFSLLTTSESYWNTDIKSIQSALQNIKYSPLAFRLDNLITKVNAHQTAFNKDIIVITDGVGLQEKHLQNRSKNNNTYFIVPKAEQKNNVSVDSVYIKETTTDFYKIGVTLSAYGNDINPVPVAVYNNSKLIAKAVTKIATAKESLEFTIPKDIFHGYISITDNGLEYDNNLYFSISKVKKINILAIGDNENNNFLSRIYTNDEFNYISSPLASLDYNALEKQDVVVLNELEIIPQALQTTLKSVVEKGSNLVVIPAKNTNPNSLSTFLNNFGSIQVDPLETTNKLVSKINFSHPLYASVFENKISNFQYPTTAASFTIKTKNPAALYYDDQTAFLSSLSSFGSTVYIFAAPLHLTNSNFQKSPLIVPTIYKMGLTDRKNGISAVTIGTDSPYFVDAQLSKDAILEVKNKAEQFIPIQQIMNNRVKLTFNDYPAESGNFEIYNKSEWIENISFNTSRTESNLTVSNSDNWSEYRTIESVKTIFDELQSQRSDSQIWKWFVTFALLLLLIEMAIINFLK
tara:strand:- start:457 stop:2385 length:1929 start_codon:yes stop_codon:yes gene_type:complete